MNESRARTTDLNLLVTLAALLETHNVSRAAESLGLSQPAVSHALNRLRDTFDDQILVRSGRVMVPTPRAIELLPAVREVIAEIERILVPPEDFIPAETTRTFVVATNGFAAQVLVPELLSALRERAPHAGLRVIQTGHRDLRELLTDGEVDICLVSGRIDHLPESLMMRALFDDPFVVVVREGHPLRDEVTLEDYAAAEHVLVSPRGDVHGAVDGMLAQRGMRRRIALLLSDFMIVPQILMTTDYVITTPVTIARMFEREYDLRTFTPVGGLGTDRGALIALWHERVQNDPVSQWFRRLVTEVGERLNEVEKFT